MSIIPGLGVPLEQVEQQFLALSAQYEARLDELAILLQHLPDVEQLLIANSDFILMMLQEQWVALQIQVTAADMAASQIASGQIASGRTFAQNSQAAPQTMPVSANHGQYPRGDMPGGRMPIPSGGGGGGFTPTQPANYQVQAPGTQLSMAPGGAGQFVPAQTPFNPGNPASPQLSFPQQQQQQQQQPAPVPIPFSSQNGFHGPGGYSGPSPNQAGCGFSQVF